MNKTKGAILVLAGLNVALIYFCAVKSHESMMVSSLYRSSRALAVSLPRFVLPDADGRQFASEDILMVEEYTLFVLLSPSDCSPCLAEINFWTQLALSRQRLHVCAIARHGNIVELRQWIKNLDVRFPVLCDEGGAVTAQMGVLSTPCKVLADRHGRVLLKEGPSFDKPSQKAFVRRLDGILGFPVTF